MQIVCKTEIPQKDCMGICLRNSKDSISMQNRVKSRQHTLLREGIGFVWLKSPGLSAGEIQFPVWVIPQLELSTCIYLLTWGVFGDCWGMFGIRQQNAGLWSLVTEFWTSLLFEIFPCLEFLYFSPSVWVPLPCAVMFFPNAHFNSISQPLFQISALIL